MTGHIANRPTEAEAGTDVSTAAPGVMSLGPEDPMGGYVTVSSLTTREAAAGAFPPPWNDGTASVGHALAVGSFDENIPPFIRIPHPLECRRQRPRREPRWAPKPTLADTVQPRRSSSRVGTTRGWRPPPAPSHCRLTGRKGHG